MVESKIFSHLSTTTAITVTQSVSSRIYPMWLPQETGFPAISYTRVAGNQQYNLQGYSSMENPLIQIDVWATTYKAAKDISSAVHTAMQAAPGFKAILRDDTDFYEDEIEVYRVSMDFSCWNRE